MLRSLFRCARARDSHRTASGRSALAGLGILLALGLALLGMSTPAAAHTNTGGLDFTGDALAEVPSHTAIDTISTGLTVEAWVKHTGNSDTDAVLAGGFPLV